MNSVQGEGRERTPRPSPAATLADCGVGLRAYEWRALRTPPTSPSRAVISAVAGTRRSPMPDGLDYRCGGSAGLAPASHYSATGGNVGGALDPCQEIAIRVSRASAERVRP